MGKAVHKCPIYRHFCNGACRDRMALFELLVLVAHVHEPVLDEWRKILTALLGRLGSLREAMNSSAE